MSLAGCSQETLHSVLRTLTGPAQDGLSQQIGNHLTVESQRAHDLNPWIVSPAGADYLAKLGIAVSPAASVAHEHPIHKYIESDLLHRRIRPYLLENPGFVQIKPSKVRALDLVGPVICNFRASPRDFGRFPLEGALEDLIPCRSVFIHDVGHFMKASSAAMYFSRLPNLETLLVSSVYAFESVSRSASCIPHLYQLAYPDRDTCVYYLEGSTTDCYEQPSAVPELLTAAYLDYEGGIISAETHSVATSHLTVMRRGRLIVPRFISFNFSGYCRYLYRCSPNQ
ncbi:MAG: methyltransferase [Brapardiv virus 8]|nr:MAG: methyltransferase [Brapardiv virus 8]